MTATATLTASPPVADPNAPGFYDGRLDYGVVGLAPSQTVTIELAVPGLALFVDVRTADALGTISTYATTVYSAAWAGETHTWTLSVWGNKKGVVGRGPLLATATAEVTVP